jgi:hypothetical protein
MHFTERVSYLHAIMDCGCKLTGQRDECPHCGIPFPYETNGDPEYLFGICKVAARRLAEAEVDGVDTPIRSSFSWLKQRRNSLKGKPNQTTC